MYTEQIRDKINTFQKTVADKNILSVFYEAGAGGEFLLFLLGMHPTVSARNYRATPYNQWCINDTYVKMAGIGGELVLDQWNFAGDYKWFLGREHANLLYPTDKWKDTLNRSLEDGITDFNNLYNHFWNKSKTIWLSIDTIEDLQYIDTLGASKLWPDGRHVHLNKETYIQRYLDLKHRLEIKQSRFTGEKLIVNVRELWLNDTENQFAKIIKFLEMDNSFLEFWIHSARFWANKNKQFMCNKSYCLPAPL
jgi:hypothetical protein